MVWVFEMLIRLVCGLIGSRHGGASADASDPAGAGPQLLSVLLRDPQLTGPCLQPREAGKR